MELHVTDELPKATHSGKLSIGGLEVDCYVLENGQRVLHKRGMAMALGLSTRGGSAFMRTISSKGIASIISQELREKIDNPIIFIPKSQPGHGYEADILVDICWSIIEAKNSGKLYNNQEALAKQAEIIVKSVAKVGMVALVDEATGYQYDRTRNALEKILEKFISVELCKWAKTFPDDFYKEMFRLRNWQYIPLSAYRPGVVGHYTNDLVYERLAPGILDELKRITPKNGSGKRSQKLFQRLTEDVGHPRLREHLSAVIALMKASSTWDQFYDMVQKALPKYDEQMMIEDINNNSKTG